MTIYFYKACDAYGCFSNFSFHEIVIDDMYWSTVEHYYQAQKFLGSKDEEIISAIHQAKTPDKAAELGRCRTLKLRHDWDTVKIEVMHKAVLTKFVTHAEIREVLLSTDNELLVENSPTDYFWGCGVDKTGKNNLGIVLMDVRDKIRNLHSSILLSPHIPYFSKK
ncbi:MAG: NADAR family protein [Cyanobacteria bacterium P01_A01_bin.84]